MDFIYKIINSVEIGFIVDNNELIVIWLIEELDNVLIVLVFCVLVEEYGVFKVGIFYDDLYMDRMF